MLSLLLHVCCAPCSIHSVRYWRETGEALALYFFNPNIHPLAEYRLRLMSLKLFAEEESLDLHIDDSFPLREFFKAALATKAEDSKERCSACYRQRLEHTAQQAKQLGMQSFSTTLLISPYQQHEVIKSIGDEIAKRHGLVFRYTDLRPGFQASQSEAKERGYYRQKYCGCLFSEFERYRVPWE